jgi:hypothetical protein
MLIRFIIIHVFLWFFSHNQMNPIQLLISVNFPKTINSSYFCTNEISSLSLTLSSVSWSEKHIKRLGFSEIFSIFSSKLS